MARHVTPNPLDWHPQDIRAALAKRGITMTALALRHGYDNSAPSKAARGPWPQVERLIANALGLAPAAIWPSRYDADGQPKRERRSWDPNRKLRLRNVRNEEAA